MGYIIAIAGKGGTGKTTVAALIVRIIRERKLGSILAVDADPNSNLSEALGMEVKETIGSVLDEIASQPEKIPSGMSKDRFIEYRVQTIVAEAEGFDILVMGRPEGPGCYCYVNNVLRNIVGKLIEDYDYVVIDNEAGFEHFSRRTTRATDALLVVSDATPMGLKAAKRISDLVKELDIKTKKNLLIINCYDSRKQQLFWNYIGMPKRDSEETLHSAKDIRKERTKDLGFDYIGNIPVDNEITKLSLDGSSLIKLDNDAVSLEALRKLGDKIW